MVPLMLSTRIIDGLTVYRAGSWYRKIELTGGSEAERAQLRRDLETILGDEPTSAAFRLALGRAELLTRRAGIVIGLTSYDEAVLRRKLATATDASLEEVRSAGQKRWR